MNKKILIGILVLLAVIVVGAYFLFNKKQYNSQTNQYSSDLSSNAKASTQNNNEKKTAKNKR